MYMNSGGKYRSDFSTRVTYCVNSTGEGKTPYPKLNNNNNIVEKPDVVYANLKPDMKHVRP